MNDAFWVANHQLLFFLLPMIIIHYEQMTFSPCTSCCRICIYLASTCQGVVEVVATKHKFSFSNHQFQPPNSIVYFLQTLRINYHENYLMYLYGCRLLHSFKTTM